MIRKNSISLMLLSTFLCLSGIQLTAQQWFVRDFDISSAINQKPDFRSGGTFVTKAEYGNTTDGVLVYGTIGYSQNELTAGDGGHGNSDVVVLFNDLEGNNMWGFTFGTNQNDVVSRVIQDTEGFVVITGYTIINDKQHIFLAKVTPGPGMIVEWAKTFGEGVPTDMVNALQDNPSDLFTIGYAVCGHATNNRSFIIYTDLDGNISSPRWAHYYQAEKPLKFNSIIQEKKRQTLVTTELITKIDYKYSSSIVVAGSIGNDAYVANVPLTNGNITHDLDFSNVTVNCPAHNRPDEYVSITQEENGDMVLFGSSNTQGSTQNVIHLTKFDTDRGINLFWDRSFSKSQASMRGFPLDVDATAFGYLATFEYSGSSENFFRTVEYDFDGNIKQYQKLRNGNSWYFSKESTTASPRDLFPYFDFDMECYRALHITGTEGTVPSPPGGWSVDNIPHARLRLNTTSCIEEADNEFSDKFCEDLIHFQEYIAVQKESSMPEETFDPQTSIIIAQENNNYCESSCPQSACTTPIELISSVSEPAWLIGTPSLFRYDWSQGNETDHDLAVYPSIRPDKVYALDETDGNGCVTTYTFHIDYDGLRKTSNGLSVEKETADQISFFPNPTSGILNAVLPVEGISLEIFDATGKPVKQLESLPAGEHSINLVGQPSGLYFVRVTGNDINKVIKITKN